MISPFNIFKLTLNMYRNFPFWQSPKYFFYLTLFLSIIIFSNQTSAQLYEVDTQNLRLIYFGEANKYLVKYVAQCFENAFNFNSKLYNYESTEKITVLMHDFNDFGDAGTGTIPHNHIVLAIAPFNYEYETSPANERMNTTFNHELVHLVTLDQAASSDLFFRHVFVGKVNESSENPLTIIYSYLTDPRRSTPRWFKEGIAVFLETWMAGGIGRANGGYDEMVFRTMVKENKPIYDILAFESEGTQTDFQVGANSYLYGTRFMNYLALRYGPEKLIYWTSRDDSSYAYFASNFKHVFNTSLADEWNSWITFENKFQKENLQRISTNPLTKYRQISLNALGALSRSFYDSKNHKIYAAIDFPGQIAQIVSINTENGEVEKLGNVKGPALYYVTSLAYDSSSQTLFYTANNNDYRSLYSLNIKSGDSKLLLDEERIGDLAFNSADKSLWGIRHYNGQSTIVRIPYPYTEWNQIYSWPYGRDLYNIDISADGKKITGSLAEINGQQLLILMNIDDMLNGSFSFDTLYNFENSIPANFVFSKDGKYLYGSSYYSGVSNIYRYDINNNDIDIISNCQTGFFRPISISKDSLIVFKYTSAGFLPIMIADKRIENVSAVKLLGEEVIEEHPVLKNWIAPPPSSVNIDSLITYKGNYNVFKHFDIASFYPVVEGYKDYVSYGLRFDFSDPIGFQNLNLTASYSPYKILPLNERWHLKLSYSYLDWKFESTLNNADFYDLFGPTKVSRKGYSIGIQHHKNIIYDSPRIMDYSVYANYYGNLERLPDYQNILATYNKYFNFGATFGYKNEIFSLGAVDFEKGYKWKINFNNNVVRKSFYPHIRNDLDFGFALPINHSSIWLRSSLGYSYSHGNRLNPFTNFYFGGFGNNYIDNQSEKRYREYYSFPGVELNSIGGTNYGKLLLEWNLPPIRFSNFGFTQFFVNYARTSLFSTAIVTNFDSKTLRRSLLDFGAQIDFRFIMLFHLKMTFSVGYAAAIEKNQKISDEIIFSLKIL